jgi:hypothetical protein
MALFDDLIPQQSGGMFDDLVPQEVEGGFVASVKSGVGAAIKGAGQAAADYIPGVGQDNALKRYGEEVIEANPTAVRSLEDIADKPGTAVAEAVGNAGGSVAQMLGVRAVGQGITALAPLTGPAAPVTAVIGQAIAWFGPAAIAALPSYGGIRDKQILNDPANNEDWKAKAVATLGAAAVGAIETKFGPQNWALSAMTKEGRAMLAEKFAATTLTGSIAKGVATGAAVEGAEELVQNPIEQLAGYDDPTSKESLKETAFGGAMGAIGGGVLGGGFGVTGRTGKQQAPEPDPVPSILNAPDVDSAIEAARAATQERAAGLFEAQQTDALIGAMREREANPVPAGSITGTDPADRLAGQADPLAPVIETRNLAAQELDFSQAQAEEQRRAELDAIQQSAADENLTADGRGERQRAIERAADMQAPTAMELALQRARITQETPNPVADADVAAEPIAAVSAPVQPAAEPRLIPRAEGLIPLPRKLAEQRAAANPNLEVVRFPNIDRATGEPNGKFAYTTILKDSDASTSARPGAVPDAAAGSRSLDGNAGLDAGAGVRAPAGDAVASGDGARQPDGQPVALADAGRAGAVEPAATWFGRRGDGYVTEADARMALPSRQRVEPDLNWQVEPIAGGKYRLAGYAAEVGQSADGNIPRVPKQEQAASSDIGRGAVGMGSQQQGAASPELPTVEGVAESGTGNAPEVRAQAIAPDALTPSAEGVANEPAQPQAAQAAADVNGAVVLPSDVGGDGAGGQAGIGALGATASAAAVAQTPASAGVSAPAAEVSRYTGKYGKGMSRDAAKLEAARLNRSADGVTYTAEEHGDAKLENPWAVVGRKAPDDYTGPTMAEVEAVQDIPTTEKMSRATAIVGDAEFQRRAEAKMKAISAQTENQKALAVEATAIEILALDRREKLTQAAPAPAPVRPSPRGPAGGKNARTRAAATNPFKAFIAKHGIAMDQRPEFAPGPREQRAAMVPGYGPIFRRTGKQLDILAQAAVEEGFLTEPDATKLYEMIAAAMRGERIAPLYAEGVAEAEMQARMDRQQELESEAVAALDDLEDNELFELDDVPELDAPSSTTTEAAMRAMGFTEEEISDAVAQESRGPQADRASRGGAEQAAGRPQESAGTGRDQEARAGREGLTRPTPADVIAQQDRAAEATARDERAQIDREAEAQTLTAQDAPEQRRDNSGDMFAREKAEAEIDKRNAGREQEADPNQEAMFARGKDDTRDLIIQHNITVENLMHAERMGGLAVPSLAVTKADAPLENFGEITLLGDRDMATPGKDTKVFGADIYSPRYPNVQYKPDAASLKKIRAVLDPLYKDGEYKLSEVRTLDDLTGDKAFVRYADKKHGGSASWAQLKEEAGKLLREAGAEERIFQGFTYSGNRRYKAHTLDNVIAILKKELRGGENFNYGAGSLRAKFTPQFRSIAQIRASKDRLITKEAFEKIKEEVNKELLDLSYAMVPNGGFRSSDTGISILEEGAKIGLRRAAKEYDIELSDEQVQRASEFLTKLRNMPTQYFEAKVLRAMDVGEFKAAVVPSGLSAEARELLERKGLKLYEYKKGDDADRARVVQEAARETPDAMFRRGDTSGPTLRASQIQRAVDKLTLNWLKKPDIHILDSMADAPDPVRQVWERQNSQGAVGDIEGFHWKGGVYLIADQMRSGSDIIRVLYHESIGHFGLRQVFGRDLDSVLRQVAAVKPKEMKAKAEQYGFDLTNERQRMSAAEEILAEMAQTRPENTLVQKAVAIIRKFLRENAPGFANLKLTDAEIIEQFLVPAREFVENGKRTEPSFSRGTAEPAPTSDGAMFSRSVVTGQTNRTYSPEQKRAMRNVGFEVDEPTMKERAQALWQDAGKKLAQGIVDQFAPVKDLDKQAYGLLRLSKGSSGAFESFLRGGQLKLTDGVYDFDDAKRGGVVDTLLIPLQGEHHDFFRWVAANRAERLMAEGRENLFTPQDIADLKTLASGTTSFDYTVQTGPGAGMVTRDRTKIYADSQRIFNEFNKNALDMAEQSGLIDPESRKLWEHEFYVPFYRVADDADGGVRGMNIKGGMVRQQAIKQLKGGKNALNADLLDNTLMNWAHLLDAAAKNRAAKATLEAAERMGVAVNAPQYTANQIGAATGNKNGVVWFMDGGQKRFFVVDDPYILTALTSLEYAGMRNPVMNAMGTFKHALTVGVTASPFFKVRNLIRDSVQVIGTSRIGVNPLANVAEGWKLTDPKSDEYFRLLAGGGTIHFGTMLEGSEAKRVQSLVESGVDDATILNSDAKVKAFYRKFIEPGITAYNELGNRGEAVNRAALYEQLKAQGLTHAEASLQARDLMDFSMQGSFTTIRFLTQVVPFLNARLQGLYKLGRSAKEDPARFSAVLGATALFSLALLAAYSDDDDWKKREEWDRNNFWWFKFGGTAFRIPKPFEIGAIATLAERGFELAFDKEMSGKRFRQQVMHLLGDNLSMNPVPQLVKPVLDVYANRNSFSGRPIESMGMERLKSEYRFTDRTSMAARAASTGMNAVTGLVGAEALSPVQIDSMIRGYFGWLGAFIVGAGDVIARPATGQAKHPTPDYWKTATGGMVSGLDDAPSRYVSQMYEQAREIEQAYGTWRSLQKEGKTEDAMEFFADNKGDLIKYRGIERVKRAEAKFNERIRMIERSNMDPDKKRDLIRTIRDQKDRIARLAA